MCIFIVDTGEEGCICIFIGAACAIGGGRGCAHSQS